MSDLSMTPRNMEFARMERTTERLLAKPSVRVYNYCPGGVNLQLNGRHANTPMYAIATLDRTQLNDLKIMIDKCLEAM